MHPWQHWYPPYPYPPHYYPYPPSMYEANQYDYFQPQFCKQSPPQSQSKIQQKVQSPIVKAGKQKCVKVTHEVRKLKTQEIQDEQFEINMNQELRQQQQKKRHSYKQHRTRNFHSTLFKIFLRKLTLYKTLYSQEIEKIIQLNALKITVPNFYSLLKKKSKTVKNYVRMEQLKNIFALDLLEKRTQTWEFTFILRVLMRRYLVKDFVMYQYHSSYIKNENTELYLTMRRKFQSIFLKNGC